MNDVAVVLGVPIDDVTTGEAIERIGSLIAHGRASGLTHQVVTVNVDFLVNALEEPALLRLLQGASLSLADGMPVLWSAALFGSPLRERVAGADLVPMLAQLSAQRGWKVHLFGGVDGVAERARRKMVGEHPGALITADEGPVIADVANVDPAVIERIIDVDADIVCVALGNPKQERFIASHGQRVGAPVMVGIGGSLDMYVGDRRRAPRWAQRTGVEWAFRAVQEPGRLGRRYAHDARVIVPALWRYRKRVGQHCNGADVFVEVQDGLASIGKSESGFPASFVPEARGLCRVQVNLGDIESLNPRAHAIVISALRTARRWAIPFEVEGIGDTLTECLEDYGTARVVS